MGGWVGWARWLGRLFDPVRDEVRAVGAFEGMGTFGGMMWS